MKDLEIILIFQNSKKYLRQNVKKMSRKTWGKGI